MKHTEALHTNDQLDFEFMLFDFYVNGQDYINELSLLDITFGNIDVDAMARIALTIPDLPSAIEAYLDFIPTDEGLESIAGHLNYDFDSFII